MQCKCGWLTPAGGSAGLWPGHHTRRRPPLFPFVIDAPVRTVVDGPISGGCLGVPRRIRHTCAAARRGARFCTLLRHSCPVARFRLQIKRRVGMVVDGVGWGGGRELSAPSHENPRRQATNQPLIDPAPAADSPLGIPLFVDLFQSLFAKIAWAYRMLVRRRVNRDQMSLIKQDLV